jgi:hypothetical protein
VTIKEFIEQNCANNYELQSFLNVHMVAAEHPEMFKEHYCEYLAFKNDQEEKANASAADEDNVDAKEADNDSDNDDENAANNEELNHREEGAFASNDADNQTSTQSPSSSSSAAQFANEDADGPEDDNGNDDSDEEEEPVTPEPTANKTTFWNRWWVKATPRLLILGGLAYFGWQWLKKTKN